MEITLTQELKDTCLYMHTRKSDGRIFYIGIGNKRRPYRTDSRNNHWRNIVKKDGFEVTILLDNLTWERACEVEKIMIDFYGRKDLKRGPLVNETDGGDGQKNPTEETRKKLRDAKKGNTPPSRKGIKQSVESRKKMSIAKKNMSEDTKFKMSKSKLGTKHTEQTIKKMVNSRSGENSKVAKIVVDITNGIFYDSIKDAANVYGLKRTTLSAQLSGQNINKTSLRCV